MRQGQLTMNNYRFTMYYQVSVFSEASRVTANGEHIANGKRLTANSYGGINHG